MTQREGKNTQAYFMYEAITNTIMLIRCVQISGISVPTDVWNLRSFLILVSHQRSFCSSPKAIEIPLKKHQQNNTPCCFSAACKHAFEKIPSNHISELLLNNYDPIITITSLNDLSVLTCTNIQGLSPNWQSGNQC